MKDILCKEINVNEIKKYQMEILVSGVSKLFIPVSFKTLEEFREDMIDSYVENPENNGQMILACYDISGLDLMPMVYDGAEAPYIASELLKGMSEAMDNYIMPYDYNLNKDCLYRDRHGRIKVVFSPSTEQKDNVGSLGQDIKRKIATVLELLYPEGGIAYQEILIRVKETLLDETIGLDTCLRGLERLKSEGYYLRCGTGSSTLDFSSIMV